MLLFQLTSALALLPFDSLTLSRGKHLLVLDPQLPSIQLEVIHGIDDGGRLVGVGEVGKSQTTKDAIVEVVVKRVWLWEVQRGHDALEDLLAALKLDVLNDDGCGDQLLGIARDRGRETPRVGQGRQIMLVLVHVHAGVGHLAHRVQVLLGLLGPSLPRRRQYSFLLDSPGGKGGPT